METSPTPILEIHNLTKFYGQRRGVEDVSFSVPPGEIVGFLGPNGSGKTTVMRMVMGLIRPTRGTVSVQGRPVRWGDVDYRASIGYLPGTFGTYPEMTVHGFLDFLARIRGLVDLGRMNELMDRLDLDGGSRIEGLSKGNRQKIGVVQALMHRPRLLLLDEPTSGLDPLVQRAFEAILREEQQRGVSVLLSSHVMSEVDQLAARAVILWDGRVAVDDEVAALKATMRREVTMVFPQPAHEEWFIGARGVVEVAVDGCEARCVVEGSQVAVLAIAVAHGVVAVYSVEPSLEDVFVSRTGPPQ
jgi:ABC-2 type transport system ATP-binding protein